MWFEVVEFDLDTEIEERIIEGNVSRMIEERRRFWRTTKKEFVVAKFGG